MSLAGKLTQGRIVYATYPDGNGVNIKTRPGVLLHDAQTLVDDDPVFVVPITSTVPTRIPSTYVDLPHGTGGRRCFTGLTVRSFAVCAGWIPQLCLSDIQSAGGIAPAQSLLRILDLVASHWPPRESATPPPADADTHTPGSRDDA
jgi:hypothetical protein